MRYKHLYWLLALAIVAITLVAQRPDTEVNGTVRLVGSLGSRTVWGPPGFGETPDQDQRAEIFVLQLDMPKNEEDLGLVPTPEVETEYSEVQLVCRSKEVAKCEERLRETAGKHVSLRGRAEYAVYPSDYLPIVVDVLSIEP